MRLNEPPCEQQVQAQRAAAKAETRNEKVCARGECPGESSRGSQGAAGGSEGAGGEEADGVDAAAFLMSFDRNKVARILASRPPALSVGENCRFPLPRFLLDVAGIRRPVVYIRGLDKEDLLPR